MLNVLSVDHRRRNEGKEEGLQLEFSNPATLMLWASVMWGIDP